MNSKGTAIRYRAYSRPASINIQTEIVNGERGHYIGNAAEEWERMKKIKKKKSDKAAFTGSRTRSLRLTC